MKTEAEVRQVIEDAANQDGSFAQLANEIGHSENCTRILTLAHFAGQPLKCECAKGTL